MPKVPTIKSNGKVHINIDPITDKVEIRLIEDEYRFASLLMRSARLQSNLAKIAEEKTDSNISTYVISSIILSYSFLEAGLNEFIFLTYQKSELNEVIKREIDMINKENLRPKENRNILQQYNMYLRIIEKPQIEESNKVYQSANLVRSIRNMLVHPIPGDVVTYSSDPDFILSDQQDIVKKLKGPLRLSKEDTFPECIYNYKCSNWAIKSCESFFKEFIDRSEVDPGFTI
jgi:hypothetical protein